MAILGRDKDKTNNYGVNIIKLCEMCRDPKAPQYLYRFNFAWLCYSCYMVMRKKYPTVVIKEEIFNNLIRKK